jgi:DNA-binding response OmpR family regulator
VGAVLRRARPNAESPITEGAAPATTAPSAAANGLPVEPRRYLDLLIDLAGRDVRRGPASIALTRVEFELLAALTEHPGVVLDREQLGAAVFGEAFDAFDRTIDSHVKNLRRKLGFAPGDAAYIETVRGVGYRATRAALEARADGPAREAARVPA